VKKSSWLPLLDPGQRQISSEGCRGVRRPRETKVPPHTLMKIMQQKPLYKQFIYSKQQHRQNAI
jgi:hypothetical protein